MRASKDVGSIRCSNIFYNGGASIDGSLPFWLLRSKNPIVL